MSYGSRMSQTITKGKHMRHTIKTEILQAVLNYLASKPYNEVQALVTAIQSDAKVDALAKAEADAKAAAEAEVKAETEALIDNTQQAV